MRIFFGILISFIGFPCLAQEFYFRQMPLDFDGDIQRIALLFQGRDQMIWLGTDQGLYSFDGKNYWKTERPDGAQMGVTAIGQHPSGEIWTGYEDGVIIAISETGHTRNVPTDSLKGFSISKILFHPDGDVIIATYGKGIWIKGKNQLSRITHDDLAQIDDVYDIVLHANGSVWLATDRGIWIYDPSGHEGLKHLGSEHGLPDEIVTKLLADKNGNVWIGLYDHGLGKYIAAIDSIFPLNPLAHANERIVGIVKGQSENEIWISTEENIGNYNGEENIHQVKLPSGIKPENLLFDRTGNLWVTANNKLYTANIQLSYITPSIAGIQSILSLNHKLWLGCESGLFSMDQDGNGLKSHLTGEQINILSMYTDPSGLIWIGTFGQGLFVFDPSGGRFRHLTEKENISNNSILNIDGRDHTIWLATLGGITEIKWMTDPFSEKLTVTVFQEKYKFSTGYVYDVYVASDGKVWFGTDGKGLYYLEKDQLHAFNHPLNTADKDSVDLKTIYSITTDLRNNLWISSTKGNMLNVDTSGHVLGHLSAAHGSLNSLITTHNGEIIMMREGAIQIKNPVYGVFAFSSTTGLSSFSPNLNALCEDKDGSIWLADADKVLHYVPLQTDSARYVHMHLVDISPGGFNEEGSVRLEPDSNFLDLRFTGLWYPDPSRVQYRYMLKGHDKDWIYTQEGRAVYSRLSPGTYSFIVAGSYNDDFTQSRPFVRQVIVLPPFYFTWWFLTGSVLLISILTWLFFRSRIRHVNKLHQLEKEKTTLQLNAIQAQVNPHFLFNSFNTLASIIEEDQKNAVAYVDQLSGFFRGVLMHREAELITLEEEIIIMRNYIYILQQRYGDNICIEEEIHSMNGYIAPLSIQLLVENAIKHNKITASDPLKIHIAIADKWVVVSNPVRPKIQSMVDSTGFGLNSLLTRYQYLTSAKIEILNNGHTFTVKIPVIQVTT